MAKYLLVYKTDEAARARMAEATPEQAQAGMDAWMAWFGKAGSAVLDFGSPVTATGDADVNVGGYSVVEAEDTAAVAALLEGHPHAEVGTIDVHELLAIPGM
jgi:hypothetical protein